MNFKNSYYILKKKVVKSKQFCSLRELAKNRNEWWREKVFSFAANWMGYSYFFSSKIVSGGYIFRFTFWKCVSACYSCSFQEKRVLLKYWVSFFVQIHQNIKSINQVAFYSISHLSKLLNYFDTLKRHILKHISLLKYQKLSLWV